MSARRDLVIDGGVDHRITLWWNQPKQPGQTAAIPMNLTGYAFRMQARLTPTTPDPPLCDLSTGNGGITVTPLQGKIEILIPRTTTALWTFETAVWETQYTEPGGFLDSLIKGNVGLSPGVVH